VLLPDVNILVNAYREDTSDHERFQTWLEDLVNSEEAFGLSDLVCSGFLRITTHPGIFRTPSPLNEALTFTERTRSQPNCVLIVPGPRHWNIFAGLCRASGARGNLIADAYLAALAIESGSEWITTDGDFARFPGLRWRRPFA
jgi:toxin-antitoxin system PIN domain toxin